MFDRVNDLSDSLIGGGEGDVDIEPAAFADLLENGEDPVYVLASDSVEHETDGRTTTVEPDGNHAAYLLATDERVVIVLGDQPDEAEIAFEMVDISTCTLTNGLLNSTLVVGHETESVSFSPTAGDVERVNEYVTSVSDSYRSVEASIGEVEDRIDSVETSIREDKAVENLVLRTRTKLSEARHQAFNAEKAPSEKLRSKVTDAEREFERRYVKAWIERGEAALETAASAAEDDYSTFCDEYTTAATAAETLADVGERFDHVPEDRLDRVEDLVEGVDGQDTRYVEACQDALAAAREAEGPAPTQWLDTYRRFDAAHNAGWDGTAELPQLSTRSELDSIAEHTVDALVADAEALETEGESREDDDAEAARSRYERAAERLREARDIAEKWADVDGDPFENQLATLEEKIDRTKWEWGSPGDAE